MEFQTSEQREAFERVGQWLQEMYGESVIRREEIPAYQVPLGSGRADVAIYAWPNMGDAVIRVVSVVALGSEIRPDLTRYLLEENESFRFGAFALDTDGDVSFLYSLPASAATKQSIRRAIELAATTADKYCHHIIERWGGRPGY
jgi:hypothetical protein